MPAPMPYPTPTDSVNAVPFKWSCDDRLFDAGPPVIPSGTDCYVTEWQIVPAPVTIAESTSSPVVATAYPGGYEGSDNGNWTDLGPWFAAVICAAVLAPFAFRMVADLIRRSINV